MDVVFFFFLLLVLLDFDFDLTFHVFYLTKLFSYILFLAIYSENAGPGISIVHSKSNVFRSEILLPDYMVSVIVKFVTNARLSIISYLD